MDASAHEDNLFDVGLLDEDQEGELSDEEEYKAPRGGKRRAMSEGSDRRNGDCVVSCKRTTSSSSSLRRGSAAAAQNSSDKKRPSYEQLTEVQRAVWLAAKADARHAMAKQASKIIQGTNGHLHLVVPASRKELLRFNANPNSKRQLLRLLFLRKYLGDDFAITNDLMLASGQVAFCSCEYGLE
jgi:hypothetical protein